MTVISKCGMWERNHHEGIIEDQESPDIIEIRRKDTTRRKSAKCTWFIMTKYRRREGAKKLLVTMNNSLHLGSNVATDVMSERFLVTEENQYHNISMTCSNRIGLNLLAPDGHTNRLNLVKYRGSTNQVTSSSHAISKKEKGRDIIIQVNNRCIGKYTQITKGKQTFTIIDFSIVMSLCTTVEKRLLPKTTNRWTSTTIGR